MVCSEKCEWEPGGGRLGSPQSAMAGLIPYVTGEWLSEVTRLEGERGMRTWNKYTFS